MSSTTHNPSGDEKPLHSHSGEEDKPQGAFKTINYDQNTGGVSGVKVTPASKEAQAMAEGEDTPQSSAPAADNLDDMTVEQLKDEARDAEVSGFSTMHKDELVKAVRKSRKAK